MEVKYAIVLFGVLPLLIMLIFSWWLQGKMNESHNKLVNAQQDTIQKLLNREPVTYKEVGKPEPKEEKEARYSAWGSRMLTDDDYNKEQ